MTTIRPLRVRSIFIIIFLSLFVFPGISIASDKGICTLADDNCNLMFADKCKNNKSCFIYSYQSFGSKEEICAKFKNSCLDYKDYQSCQNNKGCVWKGDVVYAEINNNVSYIDFCSLSSDNCNSFSVSSCPSNVCVLRTYNGLSGGSAQVCVNKSSDCLGRDYTGCLAALGRCKWYGLPQTLPEGTMGSEASDGDGENSGYSGAPFPSLTDPMQSIGSPQSLLGKIINIIMGMVGSLALIMFIFGGISWMTAGGNEQKVKQSIGIIVWSALGLAVIFLSYALVKLLITNVSF